MLERTPSEPVTRLLISGNRRKAQVLVFLTSDNRRKAQVDVFLTSSNRQKARGTCSFDLDAVALNGKALHRIPRLFWFTFARLFSKGGISYIVGYPYTYYI